MAKIVYSPQQLVSAASFISENNAYVEKDFPAVWDLIWKLIRQGVKEDWGSVSSGGITVKFTEESHDDIIYVDVLVDPSINQIDIAFVEEEL